ncbi:MAG: DUF1653 domain-containing protein [Clostridium sp.]
MTNWIHKAKFYHIYPLGFLGAPQYHQEEINHRLHKIIDWIPHMKSLGINALYLGPVFESHEHGYDTSDYRCIDHRIGTNEDFKEVCNALHEAGIRIVLDGVFNHVGRDFWAFQDVQRNGSSSKYCNWFSNLHFHAQSPLQDPFTYDAWEGHFNLVKLNLENEELVQYLLESVAMWMDEFQIDGIRLDAADCIRPEFFKRLKDFCKHKNPDFWLMGEIIHGDYNRWANPEMLDSVTNYECYKGLYSSHNDKNYFEIAHSLQRQFGKGGIYEHLYLYNFVDNHDVNRLASTIKDEQDLFNIYTLLFTIPGIPSIYYGSEFALKGTKHHGSDADLRPCLELSALKELPITNHIQKLSAIRELPTLCNGTYEQVIVRNEQFVFSRSYKNEKIYIACNLSSQDFSMQMPCENGIWCDVLHDQKYTSIGNNLDFIIPAKQACILQKTEQDSHEEIDTADTTKENASFHEEQESNNAFTVEIPEIKMGKYRHFKGKDYSVLYVATHSETLEKYVVYRQLYGEGGVWVRPLSMFTEEVEVDGKKVPRFTYIGQ